MENLFIVKFYDADVEENTEMEFGNLKHAKETYDTFNGQSGVENLHIYEYDFETKEYHFVQ